MGDLPKTDIFSILEDQISDLLKKAKALGMDTLVFVKNKEGSFCSISQDHGFLDVKDGTREDGSKNGTLIIS